MTKTKERSYNRSIDIANKLQRSVDLLHIQRSMIDYIVGYEDNHNNNKMVLHLDNLIALTNDVIDNVDHQSNRVVAQAIKKINS